MIKLGVAGTSAVSEPRTAVTAATNFARFLHNTAFGTHGTDGRRRSCWCVYAWALVKTQRRKHENSHSLVCERICLHGVSVKLTFAGIYALGPPVISIGFAGTSAVLIPSTARSATTGSA